MGKTPVCSREYCRQARQIFLALAIDLASAFRTPLPPEEKNMTAIKTSMQMMATMKGGLFQKGAGVGTGEIVAMNRVRDKDEPGGWNSAKFLTQIAMPREAGRHAA